MWFPTKSKVNDALVSLVARSIRIENRAQNLNDAIQANGSGLFGRIPEIEEFRVEVSEGTKALSLLVAAVHLQQITPQMAARKLSELDSHLCTYERSIGAAEVSYGLSRGK